MIKTEYISAKRIGNKVVYHLNRVGEDNVTIETITLYSHLEYSTDPESGRLVIKSIDSSGRIREDVYEYLNKIRINKPDTTRKNMGVAIHYLYDYAELMSLDPTKMGAADVECFIQFLSGSAVLTEPNSAGKPVRPVVRSAKSVNGYLGSIRAYLDVMGMDCSGFRLVNPRTVSDVVLTDRDIKTRFKYRTNRSLKTDPRHKFECPKHIKPHEIKEILRLARDRRDDTMFLFCYLGYTYGARPGEMLGLTREDITEVPVVDAEGNVTGKRYSMTFRNRLSDNRDQYAKGLLHPASKADYAVANYRSSRWEVFIDETAYRLIVDYYARRHNGRLMGAAREKVILQDTAADSVFGRPGNYYIFSGENGRRLSMQTANNRLTKYFLEVGITPDVGRRFANCAHRLRHGFAMWHAHYKSTPCDALSLMSLMRHASVTSTTVYYTPDSEEQARIKAEFTAEIEEFMRDF